MSDPIDEAKQALATRLHAWGVLNHQARAAEYVTDLIGHGWRSPQPATQQPPPARPGEFRVTDPAPADRKAALIAEIRQTIRNNQHPEDQ